MKFNWLNRMPVPMISAMEMTNWKVTRTFLDHAPPSW